MTTPKGQLNLQDVYINYVRRERIPVTVHIKSGEAYTGYVDGFDNFTIILTVGGDEENQVLLYKHAVTAVVPLKQVMIFTQNREM